MIAFNWSNDNKFHLKVQNAVGRVNARIRSYSSPFERKHAREILGGEFPYHSLSGLGKKNLFVLQIANTMSANIFKKTTQLKPFLSKYIVS